MKKSLYGLK